jgi:uncharacterized BrkB/YihY/UPF0761 family membrane protein
VKNQFISLLLTFITGVLVLLSVVLGVLNQHLWSRLVGVDSRWATTAALPAFRTALVPLSILLLILIYRLLPNGKVPTRPIVPVAIVVGFALELLKYINVLTWPWLRAKLAAEYGPFVYSVTIVLWGFLASMLVLAGAEWAARRARRQELKSSQQTG